MRKTKPITANQEWRLWRQRVFAPGSIIPAFFSWPPLRRRSQRERVREEEWVWEEEGWVSEVGGGGERTRMCRTTAPLFLFFPPHAHSPRRSCDLLAPSVGSPFQKGLHGACSVGSNWNTSPLLTTGWTLLPLKVSIEAKSPAEGLWTQSTVFGAGVFTSHSEAPLLSSHIVILFIVCLFLESTSCCYNYLCIKAFSLIKNSVPWLLVLVAALL